MRGALTFFALAGYASAACPNGCSKHGTCGEFDQCSCDDQFQGADCSLRTCMYGYSWITTSQGDINYDGDTVDATYYSSDARFRDTSVAFVVDQSNSGGTWESWPAYFHQADDEGHFYMECSNRGLCDRETGECDCFEGYTGEACRRTVCPNDCSGHGLCLTVAQQSGSLEYVLWDKDMSRSCKCDPGFSGPSCEELECPQGDDPLTTNQQMETQFVQVFSDDDIDGPKTDGPFEGSIRLTYTDYWGEMRTTDAIAVSSALAGGKTMASMATAVEQALEGIPNSKLSDVTVSADYCKQVIPMLVSLDTSAGMTETTGSAAVTTLADGTSIASQQWVICPGSAVSDQMMHFTGDIWKQNDQELASAATPGAVTSQTCYESAHANCLEFKITFASTAGDLVDLSVDTSDVTIVNSDSSAAETAAQGATSIGSAVVDVKALVSPTLISSWGYTYFQAGTSITCNHATPTPNCALSGNTLTLVDGTYIDGTAHREGERIKIMCGTKDIGTYTVTAAATAIGSATLITLDQSTPGCSGLDAANEIAIIPQTSYLEVTADFTSVVSIGDTLQLAASGKITPKVTAVNWNIDASLPDVGRIHLGDGNDGKIVDSIASSGTVTYLSAITVAATTQLNHYGRGTTESSVCSDRGVCDSEAGDCKCFQGYTGLSCSIQNALAA